MPAIAHKNNKELGTAPAQTGVMTLLSCLENAELVKPLPVSPLSSLISNGGHTELPDYLTDVRMAENFITYTKDRLKYWHESGQWIDYDETKWGVGTPGGAYKFIKEFLSPMFSVVIQMEHGPKKNELLKALLARESMSGQKNMLDAAAVQPTACISTLKLDYDPWLINFNNVTINLKTGTPQVHRHDNYITKIANIEYDPTAECPEFIKFISQIMGDDKELIAYMQRWVGYCMTGDVSEQVFQVWYGTGANGKSVLSSILAALLGDYAKAAGGYLLLQKPSGAADLTTQAELAKLRGVRLACISEIDEGSRLAEAQLKNITGGDTITCRTLYKEPFEYEPAFKIILLCNHKPQVRGTDNGIWRRIHIVPFAVTIPPEKQDPYLKDKLRAERSGILNWAITGCREWRKQGLKPPEAVLSATADYKTNEDMFTSWLNDCCHQGAEYSSKAKDLLESFKTYSGWKNTNHKKFGTMMANQGFVKTTSNGVVWHGLEPLEPLTPNYEKSHGNINYGNFPKNVTNSSKGSKNTDYSDHL